jgi:S1-C subfamily serine protease
MSEQSTSQAGLWRRLQRHGARARSPLLFASGVLAALAALVLYSALTPGPKPLTTRDVNDTVAQALASATPPPPFSVYVNQAIRPSLVLIQTEIPGQDETDGKRNNAGKSEEENAHGLGSGVVINDRGDILTSLHVVAGATDIQITFADGTQSSARVMAEQPENDIAVLRARQPPALIVPAMLGNPNAVRIGDEAFVVGNPLGLYGSMSAGVISGLKRTFQPSNSGQKLEDLIQFDAAVNPGNSGGPLLNRYGQVIGIVTGLMNPTEQEVFIGIGFAVPIDVAGGAAGMPPY